MLDKNEIYILVQSDNYTCTECDALITDSDCYVYENAGFTACMKCASKKQNENYYKINDCVELSAHIRNIIDQTSDKHRMSELSCEELHWLSFDVSDIQEYLDNHNILQTYILELDLNLIDIEDQHEYLFNFREEAEQELIDNIINELNEIKNLYL